MGSEVLRTKYEKCLSCKFVSVYIKEAHAYDEWPLGNHCVEKQHTTIGERAAAAARFLEHGHKNWSIPMYLDTMNDSFAVALAAHPERFFVFDAHDSSGLRLMFASPGQHGGYTLNNLERFLESISNDERAGKTIYTAGSDTND